MEQIDSRLLYLDIPVNSEAEDECTRNSVSSSSSRTSVTKFRPSCLNFRVKTFTSKQECAVVTNFNDTGFFDTLWFAEFKRPVDFFSFHKQLTDAVESLNPSPKDDPAFFEGLVTDHIFKDEGNNIETYIPYDAPEIEFGMRRQFHFDDIAKNSPFRFGPNLRQHLIANKTTNHPNNDFINRCYKHLNKFLNSKVTTKLQEQSRQTRTRKALENISSVMNRITNQELSKLYSASPVKCENYGYMLSIYYKQFLRVMYDKVHKRTRSENASNPTENGLDRSKFMQGIYSRKIMYESHEKLREFGDVLQKQCEYLNVKNNVENKINTDPFARSQVKRQINSNQLVKRRKSQDS